MASIFLTGVTGAVGSSLAPLLKERGHKLICLVRGNDLGKPEEIGEVFAGFQKFLYQEAA